MTLIQKFQKRLRQRAQSAHLSQSSLNHLSHLQPNQLNLASKAVVQLELESGFLSELSSANPTETTKHTTPPREQAEHINSLRARGQALEDMLKPGWLLHQFKTKKPSLPISEVEQLPGEAPPIVGAHSDGFEEWLGFDNEADWQAFLDRELSDSPDDWHYPGDTP